MIDQYKNYIYLFITLLIIIIIILLVILLIKLGKLMKKTAMVNDNINEAKQEYIDINKRITKKKDIDDNKTLRYLSSALLIISISKQAVDNYKKSNKTSRKFANSFKKACIDNRKAIMKMKF